MAKKIYDPVTDSYVERPSQGPSNGHKEVADNKQDVSGPNDASTERLETQSAKQTVPVDDTRSDSVAKTIDTVDKKPDPASSRPEFQAKTPSSLKRKVTDDTSLTGQETLGPNSQKQKVSDDPTTEPEARSPGSQKRKLTDVDSRNLPESKAPGALKRKSSDDTSPSGTEPTILSSTKRKVSDAPRIVSEMNTPNPLKHDAPTNASPTATVTKTPPSLKRKAPDDVTPKEEDTIKSAISLERKPISVAKLGKMKKRDPNDRPSQNRVVRRSPTPEDRPPRAHDKDKLPDPVPDTDRQEPTGDPAVKKQKRPGARRDPAEAERERQETLRRQDERDRKAREAANLRNQYHRGSEVVRSHYNARPNQGREQRNQSPIVNLRNFNNWIKSTLIRNFTEERGLHVLDMGCGKGGDLMKWDKAQIASYTGIDLAEVSIDQARGRYRNMRNARFPADFYAFDCFSQPLTQLLPPDRRTYDIVSMQFCMHYAFETEARARQTLSNVACSLPRGGKFIGTIPSSDEIIRHINKLAPGVKEWGNGIYRVEFENPPPEGPDVVFRPAYGHKYTFYLKDAVDIVPEYVVPFNAFRALAEEYNLELLYHKGFHELFDENCDTFDGGMLLDRMGVVKKDGSRGIEGDEREACGFYSAFCFEKRGAK